MGGWAFHGVGFGYFLRVRKVWAKWEIVLCGNAYEGRDAGHNGGWICKQVLKYLPCSSTRWLEYSNNFSQVHFLPLPLSTDILCTSDTQKASSSRLLRYDSAADNISVRLLTLWMGLFLPAKVKNTPEFSLSIIGWLFVFHSTSHILGIKYNYACVLKNTWIQKLATQFPTCLSVVLRLHFSMGTETF